MSKFPPEDATRQSRVVPLLRPVSKREESTLPQYFQVLQDECDEAGESLRAVLIYSRGKPGQREGRRIAVHFSESVNGIEEMLGLIEAGKAYLLYSD